MKDVKKFIASIIGGILLLIGILMIILPGPALIIIPLALIILNSQYPDKSKIYIRKFQRWLSKSAHWLDNMIKKWN